MPDRAPHPKGCGALSGITLLPNFENWKEGFIRKGIISYNLKIGNILIRKLEAVLYHKEHNIPIHENLNKNWKDSYTRKNNTSKKQKIIRRVLSERAPH